MECESAEERKARHEAFAAHCEAVKAKYEAARKNWTGLWPSFDRLSHAERMEALRVQS